MERTKKYVLVVFLFFLFFLFIPTVNASKLVVVSDNPFDKAVAEIYADKFNAEVVVLPNGDLDEASAEKILTSNCSEVDIIGGPGGVSIYVEILLGSLGGGAENKVNSHGSEDGVIIRRFLGSDRYKTSLLVAEQWEKSKGVFLVHGFDILGLKKIESQAKEKGYPIIYYNPYHVPPKVEEVNEVIEKLECKEIIKVSTPVINNISTVSKRNLLRTEPLATEVIKLDPKEQAENIIREAKRTSSNLSTAEKAFNTSMYGEAFILAASVMVNRNIPSVKYDTNITPIGAILRLIRKAGPYLIETPPAPRSYNAKEWEQKWSGYSKAKENFKKAKKAFREGNRTLAKQLALEALEILES